MHSAPAILLLLSLLVPRLAEAQSTSPGAVPDSTAQQLTKVSRCPAVPGGQLMTGPRDTAAAKSDSNCASAMAAMAGAQAQMSPAQMAQLQAMMNPAQMAQPKGQTSPDLAAQMQALMSPTQMAQLKGQMSPEMLAQMQALMNPAQMAQLGGQMSPELLAKMQAQMSPAQMKPMQGGQLPSGQVPAEAPGVPPQAGGPGMTMPGMAGEGGGKNIVLSSDLASDLKKGKTVVRNIDWMPGMGAVRPGGSEGFNRAMVQVAAAMKQAGGAYRVDLYMDKQSGDIVVRTLGPQRLAAVQASLLKGGATPQLGLTRKDGDPRLEIVRLK